MRVLEVKYFLSNHLVRCIHVPLNNRDGRDSQTTPCSRVWVTDPLNTTVQTAIHLNSLYLICIALNHRYSLKGLNRPYIYDIPLTLTPKRARKNSLNEQGRNLEKERRVGDPSFQG